MRVKAAVLVQSSSFRVCESQCVSALQSLPCMPKSFLAKHDAVLQDLTGLSELVLELHQQQQLTWLGGVTNHEDIFQPLYRMLLALHTTASSQMVLDKLPSMPRHLQRARDCLQQVDLNPVLAALLLSTIDQWKEETTDQVSYSLFSCRLSVCSIL